MHKNGPIIIVDDDEDDRQLTLTALKQLKVKNKCITFTDGHEALEYLKTVRDNPFLIICDLKMHRMDGLMLLKEINKDKQLKERSIPFVIFSGSAEPGDVTEAYKEAVQGFFVKPATIDELVQQVDLVVSYWQRSKEPSTTI